MGTGHKIAMGLFLIGLPLQFMFKHRSEDNLLIELLSLWWWMWGTKTWAFECWHRPKEIEQLDDLRVSLQTLQQQLNGIGCEIVNFRSQYFSRRSSTDTQCKGGIAG